MSSINAARSSLGELLNDFSLEGKTFLDVGSGSGLHSLAALQLGVSKLVAFDYDNESVSATKQIITSNFQKEVPFLILEGDITDQNFIESLGKFDIVYSWGVLHHTGNMKQAIINACTRVKPEGLLVIAIYNDQGWVSKTWLLIKYLYCNLPTPFKNLLLIICMIRLWLPTTIKDLINGKPNHTWKTFAKKRGMSPMIDLKDWVGGYPFEVATPEMVQSLVTKHDFYLYSRKLVDGHGCNEYVFIRN